ncbi:hypothetical protein BH10ACT1_BH10ACT1_36060 [soil metagenome]
MNAKTTKTTEAERGPRRSAIAAAGLAALALGSSVALRPAAAAAPPEPTYATATVDGSPAEWSGTDQWGTIASNDPPNRTVASASLRYDCTTSVLYVLVQVAPGEIMQTADPAEAYVRLGSSGKLVSGASGLDGTAPDFAWVGSTGPTATGFEASAEVAPGSYPASLRIHAKLPDDSGDGYETVDLVPRYSDLVLSCPEVVATTVTSTSTTTTTSTTAVPVTPTSQAPAVADANIDGPTDPGVAPVELARTGSSTGPLAGLGTLLVMTGIALRRRARQALR